MLQDGQVVLIRFPHGGSSKSKLRPALVIRRLPGRYDDWLICLISTKLRLDALKPLALMGWTVRPRMRFANIIRLIARPMM